MGENVRKQSLLWREMDRLLIFCKALKIRFFEKGQLERVFDFKTENGSVLGEVYDVACRLGFLHREEKKVPIGSKVVMVKGKPRTETIKGLRNV